MEAMGVAQSHTAIHPHLPLVLLPRQGNKEEKKRMVKNLGGPDKLGLPGEIAIVCP